MALAMRTPQAGRRLAFSNCSFLSATVTLAIPPTSAPGSYSGALTITYIQAGPQDQTCVPIKLTF